MLTKRAFLALLLSPTAFAATCESLASLSLPDTTITKAEPVPAGEFSLPNIPPQQQAGLKRLPAFCRVAAEIKPTSDSDIKIEVWMPADSWNGKFMGVGNGGFSGAITYGSLGTGISHGYATASTNTGHDGTGPDASFALGHPEKLVDFGYRAVHEMTLKGKAITQAFYGKSLQRAYWVGCSSGGKQGLKEAEKFPLDYDGIVSGAPANYWTHLLTGDLWHGYVTHKDPAATITPAHFRLIHEAVLNACDNLDGVKDGVIEDPTRCHFDPSTLLCKGSETEGCLTAPQVQAVRKIYQGATNPRTSESIYPGMMRGSELLWGEVAGPRPFPISNSFFQYIVFKDPAWNYLTFDFDKDVALADKIDNGLLNANDPNLKAFFAHGGKLLMYHGWNDQQISPLNSVNYYKSVVKLMGGTAKIDDSYRLFLAPGMNHCNGGDGPSRIDVYPVIDQWVTEGKAPDKLIAEHITQNRADRSRPLCPYPQVAKYKGTGSTDDAANFACGTPPRE